MGHKARCVWRKSRGMRRNSRCVRRKSRCVWRKARCVRLHFRICMGARLSPACRTCHAPPHTATRTVTPSSVSICFLTVAVLAACVWERRAQAREGGGRRGAEQVGSGVRAAVCGQGVVQPVTPLNPSHKNPDHPVIQTHAPLPHPHPPPSNPSPRRSEFLTSHQSPVTVHQSLFTSH